MAFNFDSNDVDPDKIHGGAPFCTKAGRCQLFLTEFAEYGDSKNGRHILKWEIVAHEHEDQVACVVWDYLSDPKPDHKDGGETARHILVGRATALGLLTDDIIKSLKVAGKPIAFDLADGVGRQVFAELKVRKGDKQDFIEIRSVFDVNNPKCEKWPSNAGMLAKAKRGDKSNVPTPPASSPSTSGNGNVASQSQSKEEAVAAQAAALGF